MCEKRGGVADVIKLFPLLHPLCLPTTSANDNWESVLKRGELVFWCQQLEKG